MKLIVPYVDALNSADILLLRLADWMGVECETLALKSSMESLASFEQIGGEGSACLAINGEVMYRWHAANPFPTQLADCIKSRFKLVLVHQLPDAEFGNDILRVMSGGAIQYLEPIKKTDPGYSISPGFESICGPFSGLSFGSANIDNDRVLKVADGSSGLDELVTIGGKPLLARMKSDTNEFFFVAGRSIVDIDTDGSSLPVSTYFSRLFPVAMFLRHVFEKECWQPQAPNACFIIDDPPLWKRYGFLDYKQLLGYMDRYNFHTSIAFIPYYYRKSQLDAVQMFLDRPDRLSLCYHGNDHTAAEFASHNGADLNAMLATALVRMDSLRSATDIPSEKIMVFPQGEFSREAMSMLRAQSFLAAINSGHAPLGDATPLSIAEFFVPAVMKYSDFPLFVRRYPNDIHAEDIACDVFFGKPVLIVEHHDGFKDPTHILDSIELVNKLVPGIQWASLQVAANRAYLSRRKGKGLCEIRAFSNSITVRNDSKELCQYSVQWPNTSNFEVETILLDSVQRMNPVFKSGLIFTEFTLRAGQSLELKIIYRNNFEMSPSNQSLKRTAKVYVRRTLSEFRDNYLSKWPAMLSFAKLVHRRLKGLISRNIPTDTGYGNTESL